MASKIERYELLCAQERARADVLRAQAAAFTCADIIDQLRADAVRVLSHKAFERRPRAGGYGSGRQRQDSGGLSECHLSGGEGSYGLYEETHRFK